jgi:hypothetical protein
VDRLALLLAAIGVGVGAVLVWGLNESAVAAATCLERANYELISCVGPPAGLAIAFAGILTIASAIALGYLLGRWRAAAATRRSRVTLRDAD